MPKKSDVFDPKYDCFLIFSRYFFSFYREIREIQRISAYTETEELSNMNDKTMKFQSKSVLEGTRCFVKIFEGSELPLQAFESPCTGDSGRSVQYFLPFFWLLHEQCGLQQRKKAKPTTKNSRACPSRKWDIARLKHVSDATLSVVRSHFKGQGRFRKGERMGTKATSLRSIASLPCKKTALYAELCVRHQYSVCCGSKFVQPSSQFPVAPNAPTKSTFSNHVEASPSNDAAPSRGLPT